MFGFPVSTATLMDEVFTFVSKIFDGRNPVSYYEFGSDSEKSDWLQYRSDLKLAHWWKTKGLQAFRTMHNSFLVVDSPPEQTGDRPEPYFYLVEADNVSHVKAINEIDLEWIVFRQDENTMVVIDDEQYWILDSPDGTSIENVRLQTPHEYGYCPSTPLWTTAVSDDQPLVKKHIVTNWLDALEKLLFFKVSNEDLNTYARYPIMSGFDHSCKFEDKEAGYSCSNGYLRFRAGGYLIRNKKPQKCPVCSKKRFNGPGSFIRVPVPSVANDNKDLRGGVEYSQIPVDSLNYNNSDVSTRWNSILSAITGYQGLPINDQAVNEKQVGAIFESIETALQYPQQNAERVIKWLDATLCRSRYNTFKGLSISLGTEHYVLNSSQLIEVYESVRTSAFSANTMDKIQDLYYESMYRNNPELMQRQAIVNHLDPFRHRTISEVTTMYQQGLIRFEDFMLKMNLSSYLMRFEAEKFPISQFSRNVPVSKKVSILKEEFSKYIAEQDPNNGSDDGGENDPPDNSGGSD